MKLRASKFFLLTEVHFVRLWTTWSPSWDAFLNCFALVRKNVEAASPKSQVLAFRLTTQGTYFLEAWVAHDYWCPRGKLCPEKTKAYAKSHSDISILLSVFITFHLCCFIYRSSENIQYIDLSGQLLVCIDWTNSLNISIYISFNFNHLFIFF